MTDETAHRLDALCRRFYARNAADFSATRQAAWPGWERCLPYLLPSEPDPGGEPSWRLLDAGCGNGRLAAFLAERSPGRLRYLGVDASPELIEEARGSRGADARFAVADLVTLDPAGLGEASFDAIALFAVLHHVAGRERREALLARLAGALEPGGHLVATVWRADAFARFRDKIVPWESCEARTGIRVSPEEVEPGDVLLPWKHDPRALRYCHFPDEDEANALARAAGLPLREAFDADGREGALNRYWVLGPR